MVDGM